VERAAFTAAFKLKFNPAQLNVAREQHADGSWHLHLYVGYHKAPDVQSARYFDLAVAGAGPYHPNIAPLKTGADRVRWLRYIAKGGDHDVVDGNHRAADDLASFDPADYPIGKRKAAYQDLEWTARFARGKKLKPVEWPVTLHTAERDYEMAQPSAATKKRHWWIVAPPNAGKTRWINKTFAGRSVFCPRIGKYPFEDYANQDIVVYDDRDGVTFEEFADVANCWEIEKPVYGEIRYKTQYWEPGHVRNIIVLSNKTIEQSMKQEDWSRMKKRFVQIVNAVLIAPEDKSSSDEESDAEMQHAEGAPPLDAREHLRIARPRSVAPVVDGGGGDAELARNLLLLLSQRIEVCGEQNRPC